jgi:hypothetical protein
MVGARAREIYDRQAKERQKVRKGNQPGASPANLPDLKTGDARDQVGKTVGVSGKSIDYATKVIENGVPELVQAVDEGRMSVSTAAILSAEPEEVQKEEVNKPVRRRDYKSVSKPISKDGDLDETEQEGGQEIKPKGVGVTLAYEALNFLKRIPKNDAQRNRGFQIVTDWIRKNK